MNQNDQMRDLAQKVVDCVEARAIKDWDCLHMYLSEAAQMARQALNHTPDTGKMVHVNETPKNEHGSGDVLKPAKLVRLTDDELFDLACKLGMGSSSMLRKYAQAIMDAMIKKNGGAHATD